MSFSFYLDQKCVFAFELGRFQAAAIRIRSKGNLKEIKGQTSSKNRPKIIKITKIIMKNRFFRFALETFLGHLGDVRWLYLGDFDRFWGDL